MRAILGGLAVLALILPACSNSGREAASDAGDSATEAPRGLLGSTASPTAVLSRATEAQQAATATSPPTQASPATPTPAPTATPVPPTATTAPKPTNTPPPPTAAPTATPTQGNCSPAYPTVCIPPPPPDLDCKDVPFKRFKVLAPDPHRFDSDKDGIGCES